MNKNYRLIAGAAAMLVIILDSKTALRGAADGIQICIQSVVPALFPFLICSAYLTGNLGTIRIPFLQALGKLCRIPENCEVILLTGFLGGYPSGAQAVTQAYRAGMLTKEAAKRMLGFCSNAGPAFIFGMLSPFFSEIYTLWLLWCIHILSAILVGILLPGITESADSSHITRGISLPDALHQAVRTMALICGWVILFRMIIVILEHWVMWVVSTDLKIILSGLLELTNGCISLSAVREEHLRFLLASLFLNAGGLCVGMQTISVTGPLGPGWYFPGKLLQTGISTFLCNIILPILYPGSHMYWLIPISMLWIFFVWISISSRKNNSSILRLQGV